MANEDLRPYQLRYWLWVTRPQYYLDENGNEREDLDPRYESDPGGWWTCHSETKRGDLILLWRTRPASDIRHLIQAASDAYSIGEDDYAIRRGWNYGCDYKVIYKFEHPVTVKDMRRTAHLEDWGALRANFQGRVFAISPNHWKRLNDIASGKNPGYRDFLRTVRQAGVSLRIVREEQIEESLAQNPGLLKPFGHHLELRGRQVVCSGVGGRLDLLGYDTTRKRYVVIELKNVRATANTIGQIYTYMGWVQERLATGRPVIGLVISRGYDAKFESALRVTDRILQLDLEQLGLE